MDEDRQYFPVEFVLEGKSRHLIWFTADADGFLTNEAGDRLLSFANKDSLRAYAADCGIEIIDEPASFGDPEDVLLDSTTEGCSGALNMWNILADAAASVHEEFLGDSRDDDVMSLYDRLFYGCNISVIRGDGEEFHPAWSDDEERLFRAVLSEGRALLRKALDGR